MGCWKAAQWIGTPPSRKAGTRQLMSSVASGAAARIVLRIYPGRARTSEGNGVIGSSVVLGASLAFFMPSHSLERTG